MRTLLLMVRKDLLRKARSPLGLLVVLAFPIMFSSIIALAFGGGEAPRVHLLVENLDDNFFGNALISALASDEMARHFDVEIVGDEGLSRIEKGEGSALLRIPDLFTENLIEGRPSTLELVRNPAQGIMPEIAEQLAGVLVEILDSGSRVLREPLGTLAPFIREDAAEMSLEAFTGISGSIFESVKGAGDYVYPPVIRLSSVTLGEEKVEGEKEEEAESDAGVGFFRIFLFVFPGIAVYALFLVGDLAMRDILVEGEAGTLRRQIQGPLTSGMVVRAKAAFSASVALISLVILTAFAWIAGPASIDVAGYLLLSLALILAIVGSASFIYGAAGRQQRGAVIASIVYLLLAFAGGSFIQIDAMPGIIRLVAPISPFYWGTEGYRSLLEGGAGLADILPSIVVLAAMGVVFLLLGGALLNRSMLRRGGQ